MVELILPLLMVAVVVAMLATHQGIIMLAAVALAALMLLFSPPALRWLSYSPDSANSDNSGPDTR